MSKKSKKKLEDYEKAYYMEAIKHAQAVKESSVYLKRVGELQVSLALIKEEKFEGLLKELESSQKE